MQASFARYRAVLGLTPQAMVMCGMALGFAEGNATSNVLDRTQTSRGLHHLYTGAAPGNNGADGNG